MVMTANGELDQLAQKSRQNPAIGRVSSVLCWMSWFRAWVISSRNGAAARNRSAAGSCSAADSHKQAGDT